MTGASVKHPNRVALLFVAAFVVGVLLICGGIAAGIREQGGL
jgi:hypothetical protein